MATITLVPDSDDSGWEAGTFADIDNLIATPSGTFLETSVDDDVVVLTFTNQSTIVDADTVNTVTARFLARDTGAGGKNSLNANLSALGAATTAVLVNTDTTVTLSPAAWNIDHTAAAIDAFTLTVRANQVGKGTAADWRINECELVIDYTASASGPTIPLLHHYYHNTLGVR